MERWLSVTVLTRARVWIGLSLLLLLTAAYSRTQSQSVSTVTPPSAEFGANIGDDYFLATYAQFEAYWKRLDGESDRCDSWTSGAPKRAAASGWRSSRPRRIFAARSLPGHLAPPRARRRADRAQARALAPKAKRSSGLTAGCMPTKCSARSS